MVKTKLAVTKLDGHIQKLAAACTKKTLALWASDCALRVLPNFEEKHPDDGRPRLAAKAARAWANGEIKMMDGRLASVGAHAAAREAANDPAACAAARSAGQAAGTCHAKMHAVAAGRYAISSLRDRLGLADGDAVLVREREWQLARLLEIDGEENETEES
jgi:hypothetical protein